jgi:hypothetical protein
LELPVVEEFIRQGVVSCSVELEWKNSLLGAVYVPGIDPGIGMLELWEVTIRRFLANKSSCELFTMLRGIALLSNVPVLR